MRHNRVRLPYASVFMLVAATAAGAAAPPTGPELVARAREQLGTPYAWGGRGEGGFDCSGFVNKVYAEHGYVLPRTSRELYLVGEPVPVDALAPGDIIFFVETPGASRINHVGIYAGEGEFLHASSGKGEVTYDRLSSRYYRQRFFGARRILTRPPGPYARADGSAGGGEGSLDALVHDALAAESHGILLAEHAPGERPPQLAAGPPRGELTRVGPVTLSPESTAFGVRLGAGTLGETAHLLVAPELSYFDHATAFALVLAAPLAWSLADGSTPELGGWDDVRDYAKVLRELRYGQKESDLFFELGHAGSGTLGHGALMRLLTPNVASRSVPDFAITADALSLALDVAWEEVAVQSFVADVLAPEIVGVRVAWRGDRSGDGEAAVATLGASYAVDARAPYRPMAAGGYARRAIHGIGLDAELMLARARTYELAAYADVSALLQQGSRGVGAAAGAVSSARFGGRRHVVRLRVEGRLSSPAFVPSYFDVTYGIDRTQAPVEDPAAPPLTKLALLESLAEASPRWSAYGELTYQMQRRVRLGLAYEDDRFFGKQASVPAVGRHLLLYLELRELYLPQSSRRFSFALAYHRRNFHRLAPLFAPERRNEFFFAAVGLELSRYVTLGGCLRRALDPDRGAPTVDGALDLTVRYEL